MKGNTVRAGLGALMWLCSQTIFAAPVAVISGGLYQGFTGIDVGGTLYDVTFKEGTVFSVFGGPPPVFDFTTGATAAAASTALLSAIVGVPALDADPSLTFGCPAPANGGPIGACNMWTPFALSPEGLVSLIELRNGQESQSVQNGQSQFDIGASANTSTLSTIEGEYVWADWSRRQTTSVPEPATLGLLGLAFVGMGLARRSKK